MTQLLQLAGKALTFCSRTYRKALGKLIRETDIVKNQTDILEFKNIKKEKHTEPSIAGEWVPTRSVNVNIDLQKPIRRAETKRQGKAARSQGN